MLFRSGLEHTIFHKSEVLLAVPEAKCRHRSSGHYIQTEPADLSLYREERFVLMKSSSLIRDIANLYFERAGFTPHILFECSNALKLLIRSENKKRFYQADYKIFILRQEIFET